MKFLALLVGFLLITVGLLAYSMIPNTHSLPTQSSLILSGPTRILVNPNFQSETQQNITIFSGKENQMLVNITVSNSAGNLSSIQFKLFPASELGNCMREIGPTGCIIDESVSNQTLSVPVNASSTYYFGFDNRDSSSSRSVLLSSSLRATSVITTVARDGNLNYAGLALSGFGLLVALYGVAAKTVIPWE